MRRNTPVLLAAAFMAGGLLGLTPATAQAATPAAVSTDYKSRVVEIVNKKRAANGCRGLKAKPLLGLAAQGHSDAMASALTLSHQVPGEPALDARVSATGYPWTMLGENVASGFATPKSVVKGWMNSPVHRANILNCNFRHTGIGIQQGGGILWWTQVFGRK